MAKNEEVHGVTLKLTSAIALEGQIVRAGQLIEVTQSEAKNLMARGKAVLATEREAAPTLRADGPTVDEYVAAGYRAENYPPAGYASNSSEAEILAAIEKQNAADSKEADAKAAKPTRAAK